MRPFVELWGMASDRWGGEAALKAMLYDVKSTQELNEISDDRWLSSFSHCVFRAGFRWDVVRNKWPGHEEAFRGFDTMHCAMLGPDELEALTKDTRIIRNPTSIRCVRDNAIFIRELQTEYGDRGRAFANWPETDQIGLMKVLKRGGARLGGMSGCHALRRLGKSAFVLTRDVNAALIREGVIDKTASSQRDMKQVQAAMNTWHEQSGRPMTHISQVLAFSI